MEQTKKTIGDLLTGRSEKEREDLEEVQVPPEPEQQAEPEPDPEEPGEPQQQQAENDYSPIYVDGKEVLVKKRSLPASFKMGRDFITRQGGMEEQLVNAASTMKFESFNIPELEAVINASISKGTTARTFRQLLFALAQTLANQSHEVKNTRDYTGLIVDGIRPNGKGVPSLSTGGSDYNYAEIEVSLYELIKLAFGTDSPKAEHYAEINKALFILKNTSIEIPFLDRIERHALVLIPKERGEKGTGDNRLTIILHPVFAMRTAKNYALHPQDANKRLALAVKQPTHPYYALRDLLGIQDKRKPFTRTLSQLADDMGIKQELKKNRKRILEGTLPKAFKAMVDIKMLLALPKVKNINGEPVYTFLLNEDYTKPLEASTDEEPEKTKDEAGDDAQ